jgi:hypothetical protein
MIVRGVVLNIGSGCENDDFIIFYVLNKEKLKIIK